MSSLFESIMIKGMGPDSDLTILASQANWLEHLFGGAA